MKLVVGLGNPGPKYAGTRHNVGFDVLDRLASSAPGSTVWTKFESELCDVTLGTEKVLLAAPQTFMNLSGRAVRGVVDFYKLTPQDLLVVCDDLNLEPGRLRLRSSGSAGGQKGLQNIIQHLGTQEFARLRIGIGRPPGRMDASAYVLQRFSDREREIMDVSIAEAAEGVGLWVREGIQAAMNRLNAPGTASKDEPSKDPPSPDRARSETDD
jgi:peptidyl-tRNA hydrolase, PTH1 family